MILGGWEGGGEAEKYGCWYAICMMAERWQMHLRSKISEIWENRDLRSERSDKPYIWCHIGFCDGQTDICDSRVAFEAENQMCRIGLWII